MWLGLCVWAPLSLSALKAQPTSEGAYQRLADQLQSSHIGQGVYERVMAMPIGPTHTHPAYADLARYYQAQFQKLGLKPTITESVQYSWQMGKTVLEIVPYKSDNFIPYPAWSMEWSCTRSDTIAYLLDGGAGTEGEIARLPEAYRHKAALLVTWPNRTDSSWQVAKVQSIVHRAQAAQLGSLIFVLPEDIPQEVAKKLLLPAGPSGQVLKMPVVFVSAESGLSIRRWASEALLMAAYTIRNTVKAHAIPQFELRFNGLGAAAVYTEVGLNLASTSFRAKSAFQQALVWQLLEGIVRSEEPFRQSWVVRLSLMPAQKDKPTASPSVYSEEWMQQLDGHLLDIDIPDSLPTVPVKWQFPFQKKLVHLLDKNLPKEPRPELSADWQGMTPSQIDRITQGYRLAFVSKAEDLPGTPIYTRQQWAKHTGLWLGRLLWTDTWPERQISPRQLKKWRKTLSPP